MINDETNTKITLYKSPEGSTFLTKNKNELMSKLDKMQNDGPDALRIVTDFDFTLTHFLQKNYGRSFSTHRVLQDCGLLSEDYHTKVKELQITYYPKEIDPNLDIDTKIKYIVEWVITAHG